MCSNYTGLVGLVYNWQTIIAGIGAIFGGWLAYRAGVKQANETRAAARLQIEAIAEQTAALKQQNAELKRAVARESLIAARMLDASMEVVGEDIQAARSRFAGPREGPIDEPMANTVRHTVGKPGFAYLQEKMGILDREIAVLFLKLEAAIDRMRAEDGQTHIGGLTDRLDILSAFVGRLRDLAGGEIRRTTAVLSPEEIPERQ